MDNFQKAYFIKRVDRIVEGLIQSSMDSLHVPCSPLDLNTALSTLDKPRKRTSEDVDLMHRNSKAFWEWKHALLWQANTYKDEAILGTLSEDPIIVLTRLRQFKFVGEEITE